ncbi:DUF4365 domain-containing protein [Lactococcus lactis]|uniref:DUF4365 domain-containing protein n=1 Tax=Lactococcus lactis TaxID=1358 RepID=UPI00288EF561|nr:DUF4365 domain-containing protein [Lactococcus lactis]MDT2867874.1 DUF4365 domain-containing protein [Lactococcus lactis]
MANHTERIGVAACSLIAEQNEWMFREQPINDIGIDAHIELVESTGKPKQLLALQIKSGRSYFSEVKDDCIVFREVNERQYNYWTNNSLPCILVLYNPDDEQCIWQKLTTETIKKTKDGKGKGFSVKVPLKQEFLNETSKKELLSFTSLPEHVTNYNFLLSQKKFMQIIQDGGEVKLHSTEWINKSSGRGETKLIINDGKNIEEITYPYYFPYTPYTMVFPRLFPWAHFSVDEDFFEEEDKSTWHEMACHYDHENDEWLAVGDSFEEFRKKLNPMRSIIHSGKVAEYMFNLSLNELGNSFLNIDEFVSQNLPYSDTRPKE